MASYFSIELDTTSPVLEIISPQYTVYDIHNEIIINSDEQLMNYQDIYIIDGVGKRHNLTFSYDNNNFYGNVIFNNAYSLGIATIFVRLKDEVGNMTDIISKPIEILQNTSNLTLVLSDCCKCIDCTDNKRRVELNKTSARKIDTSFIEAKTIIDAVNIIIEIEEVQI